MIEQEIVDLLHRAEAEGMHAPTITFSLQTVTNGFLKIHLQGRRGEERFSWEELVEVVRLKAARFSIVEMTLNSMTRRLPDQMRKHARG